MIKSILTICFHKYEHLGGKYVCYLDEGVNINLYRCTKCGKLKEKIECVWRR